METNSSMATDEETPLVLDHNPQPPKIVNHQKDIHILSFAFLLIFLAYGAAQNLESTINTEGDLGTTSLGVLYLSFAVCSLFASVVVRKLGPKTALLLGSTGYWFFVAANLKANWYTMIPACVYLGFCASIIWVGQGTYLTSTARSHSNDSNLHEESVIGKFNGEFYGMFALHQVFGNLITLFLLTGEEGGSTSGTTLLFLVFLFIMTFGSILMFFLTKRKGKEEEKLQSSSAGVYNAVISLLKSVAHLFLDKRILLVIPLIAYSGLQQAFVWAEYTKFIVEPTLGEGGVGGAMAVYGVFDAICSLAAGRLSSGLPSITIIVLGGVFVQAIVYFWLLLSYSAPSGILGIIYPVIMAALLGIGDGVLNTQLSALLGILFKHDLEGAFAQLKLWQSVSIAIVFFMSPYLSLQAMVLIMVITLLISVIGFLFLMLKVEKVILHRSP